MSDGHTERERRDAIVAELARLASEAEELATESHGDDSGPATRSQRVFELREEYEALLPVVAVSACPFTGARLELPFDGYDLDGPFWDHDAPVRPEVDTPPTYFALTGAVRLGSPIAPAPFLCVPGPEVPYVLPRLLEDDRIGAVVSQIPIGPHIGFAIAYFAREPAHDLPRANTWGTHEYWFFDEEGEFGWDSELDFDSDHDHDLAAWIADGSLWWVAPGDPDLTLHQSVDDCPFLDLPGRRSTTHLREGNLWWPGK